MQIAVRAGLAAMFLFTGAAHFNRFRADVVRMVPPRFPNPEKIVTISGMVEIAGAIGLLIPGVARFAAYGLILLLIAVFPANSYAAQKGLTIAGMRHPRLLIRLPLQLAAIGLLWWSTATVHFKV